MPIHPERLRTLADRLSEVAREARPPGGQWGHVRTRLLGSGLVLVDSCADRFDALVDELMAKDGLGQKFSRTFVQTALDAALGALRGGEEISQTSARLASLEQQHSDWNEEQVQHIPIWGGVVTEPLRVGKITFTPASTLHNEQLANQIGSVIARTTDPEPLRAENARVAAELIHREFAGMICAEVAIVAEPERARERAMSETEQSLAVLRYCLACFHPPQYRARLGIKGLVSLIDRPVLPSLCEASEKFGLSVPYSEPLDLSADVARMERAGLSALSGIVSEPSRNQFQQTLLRAIEWLSDSIVQVKTENRLLSLTTCLETLLTPTEREPISNAIAEGAAILLADQVADRKGVKRRVKYLYGLRSAVSHGGRKEIAVADADELQVIATRLVSRLVLTEERFESKEKLLDWIEDEKMSPGGVA